jgi:glyoxylase-like metal-dependent hydrolase (beta-lactamase superfamily II)
MDVTDSFSSSTVTIDLKHQQRDRYVACCVLDCRQEIALLDPGPSSTLSNLLHDLDRMGIQISDVGAILLTHIHFDHAGVTGTLVELNPRIRVYVHEKGAAHLIDPKRLLQSASRVFGANIEGFWGPFNAVPARNLKLLNGGEEITLGTRSFEVLYTPGHAPHHVSYFERDSKVAFVGDAAGIRISDSFVYPATPPPDIDMEQINSSLSLIEAWKPERLFLTHFGLAGKVEWHMTEFRERLKSWSEFVRLSLERQDDDLHRAQEFSETVTAEVVSHASQEELLWFEQLVSFRQNWYGLARYWRRLQRDPSAITRE